MTKNEKDFRFRTVSREFKSEVCSLKKSPTSKERVSFLRLGITERSRELYQMGVSLRNVFDELDYAYKVLLGLYKYYHSEVKPLVIDVEGNVDEKAAQKELLLYLSKIKKYDEGIARDMLEVILENDLFELDYELYKSILYEVKETYKVELLQQIEPAVRNDVYFVEGFGKSGDEALRQLLAQKKNELNLESTLALASKSESEEKGS